MTAKEFIGAVLQELCKGQDQEENEEFNKLIQFLHCKASACSTILHQTLHCNYSRESSWVLLCTGIHGGIPGSPAVTIYYINVQLPNPGNLNVRKRTGTPARFFTIFLFVKELQYSLLNPTINFWGLVWDFGTPRKILPELIPGLLLHSKYVVDRIWLPKRLIIIMLDLHFWILSFNWGFSPERWKILIPGGLRQTRN